MTQQDQLVNSLGIEMIPVAPGSFMMGRDGSPDDWDERPVHKVNISRGFAISLRPVTLEQFRNFRLEWPAVDGMEPYAAGVSWYDAVEFCKWLSEKEGKTYRLPTEAEWEYVCTTCDIPDMLSDPRQWCHDWYGDYIPDEQTDPVGRAAGIARVIRGGPLDEPHKTTENENDPRPQYRCGIAPAFGYRPGAVNDFGKHRIGMRIVQGEFPTTLPLPAEQVYACTGVRQDKEMVHIGPDMGRPYLRKRYLLPTPPEKCSREEIDAVGMDPSFRGHNHSPAIEVCPNGDVLMITYTSYREYEPQVGMIAARRRFGCEEWDMPSRMFDFPRVNDHASLLWNDRGILRFFWGNPNLKNAYPFQWTSSADNGATWDEVKFPDFVNEVGGHSKQPINTAFRDASGRMYVSSDAVEKTSVLWASDDDGRTWLDTGGRSAGRHTTYVLLKDGRILGLGGKKSDIDGHMPQAVSSDGGKTWQVSKSPFPRQTNRQRPCVIRLQSGRLFFCADYQDRDGGRPDWVKEWGSYVALSDDEGKSWRIKRLPGAQSVTSEHPALGYSVARQAPNGMIHVMASICRPALEFELNEAWILSDETCDDEIPALMQSPATDINDIRLYRQCYPDGSEHIVSSAGISNDGRYLLHGMETWFYPGGGKMRDAQYELGYKIGTEAFWDCNGKKVWQWEHRQDGRKVWTQYRPDGRVRAMSEWLNFKADGTAILWEEDGKKVETHFVGGHKTG